MVGYFLLPFPAYKVDFANTKDLREKIQRSWQSVRSHDTQEKQIIGLVRLWMDF